MLHDLKTNIKTVKYVDDTTLVEIIPKGQPSAMQEALDKVYEWSHANNLYINPSKTQELLIHFFKVKPKVSELSINGEKIEQVDNAKLLGIYISNKLDWEVHTQHIIAKASKRLYYLRQLKHAGTSSADLRKVYLSIVRPVLEYACTVWCTSLTNKQSAEIETIQKRACKIIKPTTTYDEALNDLNLEPLHDRRLSHCQKLFQDMQNVKHKLHYLLPRCNNQVYDTRHQRKYPLPKCRTNRCKNSLIPFCLFNYN